MILKKGKKIFHVISRQGELSEQHYVFFGWLGFVGFPAYYFIWSYLYPQPYENLVLRMIGSMLCFFLIIKDYWPAKLKPFLPFYWYLTLFYIITFFFTFMLLKNNLNIAWLISYVAGLAVLILVGEWVGLFILLFSGITLGWFSYQLTGGDPAIFPDFFVYMSIFTFLGIIGGIFKRNTDRMREKRLLEGMIALGSNVAHELRTPLLGLKGGIAGLKHYLPMIMDGYKLAKENGLPVDNIRKIHFNQLLQTLDRMDAEIHFSNTIIDMLLMNVGKSEIDARSFEVCKMEKCVKQALDRYPFDSAEEGVRLHVNYDNSFEFLGSPVLMDHIIFNLLKNALHFIAQAETGKISIRFENGESYSRLYFTDTGQGIAPELLVRLFDRFFTTTLTGTGVGLSFCKMVMKNFGGDIICRSKVDEYTTFVLSFPPVDQNRS